MALFFFFNATPHTHVYSLSLHDALPISALLCTGEAIAFCDQDDVWLPEKLARCEAALEANPNAGLVFTNATVVDRALNSLGFTMWEAVLFNAERQQRMTHGEAMEVLMERNV